MSDGEAKYQMRFSNNRLLFVSRFGIWYGCGDILALLCGVFFESLVLHQGRGEMMLCELEFTPISRIQYLLQASVIHLNHI